MRTVSVPRSGKRKDPAPSRSRLLTVGALRAAVRLAEALQGLELKGEHLRVRDVEAGAHLAREADHTRRRVIEEAKALRAVVRHHSRRLLEVDSRKKPLFHLRIALESPSETRSLLIRQRRPLPRHATGGVNQLDVKEAAEATGRVRHPPDRDLPPESSLDTLLLHVRVTIDGRRQGFQPSLEITLGAPVEGRRQVGRPCQREQNDHAHSDGGRQIRVHAWLILLGNRISRQRYCISRTWRPSPDPNAVCSSDPYNVGRSGHGTEPNARIGGDTVAGPAASAHASASCVGSGS